jgi:hypothetical protein
VDDEVVAYVFNGSAWVQFTGAAAYTWGDGLHSSGNDIHIDSGSGITVGADTLSHYDYTAPSSADNSNGTVIQDITLDADTFGHVIGLASVDLDPRYVNVSGDTMTGTLTLSPSSGNALITTAGNVGIGTTVPNALLSVGSTEAFKVTSAGAVTAATLDTGQGANELFGMNQNVQTSDAVSFTGITSTKVNAASGSADSVTLSGTLGIMDGSDTFRGLYLNYTNANHTGTTNNVLGIDINTVTGDAEAQEDAIRIGTGWDSQIALLESGASPTYYTRFKAGDLTGADIVYTLPITNPASGLLKNQSGTLSWDTTSYGTGSVTSVSAGAGMNFTTITTTGSVVLGTPSNITSTSTNNATGDTHTHAVDSTIYKAGGTDVAVADGGTGAGTFSANYLLKGNTTNPISSSIIYDNGTNVGIGSTAPAYKLDVNGTFRTSGIPYTSGGGVTGTGTNALATINYVQSRGMNIITNGSGLLGNNYNFTSFTFDQSDTHGGKGSFKNSTYSASVFSDELIPVDGTRTYKLSLWAKSTTHQVGAHAYFGINPYDIDGYSVATVYYMRVSGTDTTLAQAITPGDTVVHLTSAANWRGSDAAAYNRQIQIFNYTNSFGYTYPAYTYTRNTTYGYSGYQTNGAWAVGGISGNDITLTEAWPSALGTIPAGTAVSNGTSGGTYKYIAAGNVDIPEAWTNYSGIIGGWDTAGSGATNLFPYGTAFIKLLFLMNRDVSGNVTNISDVWLSEVTANNFELASSTQQGVVSTGTQTLAGAKTFTSAVTINPASNQLVLSSGASQLTLNSGTSAAGRTYTVPDVGAAGTFAMLEGSQTFSGTKTFSNATYSALFTGGNVGIGTTNPQAKLGFIAATTAIGGIDFGTDTNLYRSAANTLKTDDALTVAGVITAGSGPTTLTDSAGKILSAALNTVAVGQGGTGQTTFTKGVLVSPGTTTAFTTLAGTDNYVPKWTSTGYLSTAATLIYDSGTNVGIGTTAPNDLLEVYGNAKGINIRAAATNQADSGNIRFLENATAGIRLQYDGVGAGLGSLLIRDNDDSSEIAAFTREGNVGIGVTNPGAKLELTGGGIAVPADQKLDLESAAGNTYIKFDSTNNKIQFYVNGDEVAYIKN